MRKYPEGQMTQFHPNPKELWEEYYRVIAPVIVLNKYDDNQLNKNNGTITTNNRKSQESRDTST